MSITESSMPMIHQKIEVQHETDIINENTSDMGKGKRAKFASTRLRDYVTHTIRKVSPSSTSPAAPSSFSGTPYPITHFVNCERFSVKHKNYIAAITAGNEPKCCKEVMQHDGWRRAMAEEIKALEEQGTWVLEKLPPGKKALGSIWVYKEKYDEHGTLERLKARLVIFGHH